MKLKKLSWVFLCCILLSACQAFTLSEQQINTLVQDQLIIVEDDQLDLKTMPFSDAQVLFIGENHNLIEHQELLANWVINLHQAGYRQVLLECYQLFDWVINGYVNGEPIELPQYISVYYRRILEPIREFNLTVVADDRIQVHAVDINHDINAYFRSLSDFSANLSQTEAIQTLLETIQNEKASTAEQLVNSFFEHLQLKEDYYRGVWGNAAYETIHQMTWMQKQTYPIKKIWNRNNAKAHRLRENVIKQLVDEFLADYAYRTVINMGGYHAQRNSKLGTRHEWLGEYLSKRSPYVSGKTYLIYVCAYQGEHDNGNGKQTTFNLDETSPKNELFRAIHNNAPQNTAFLPLTDPSFQDKRVTVNYRSVIRYFPPNEIFDAFVLLPEGHIITWNRE